MRFRARHYEIQFPCRTQIMGVLNVTPDSFSDGGRFLAADAAVEQAHRLIDQGADFIDVGGESTRPEAEPVSEEEELRRVIPVIQRLAAETRTPISIDTMKPAVARAALAAGACLVNDVAANRLDPAMWEAVAEARAGYVVMHMQGTPQTMQHAPCYTDVVAEVNAFFDDRLNRLAAAGISADQVMLDVGIGFGKSVEHNLQLLGHLDSFTRWRRPLLMGASRKSFIPRVAGDGPTADRLAGSLACACWGAMHGAHMVRVHDVAETRQALRLTEALQARKSRFAGTDGNTAP